MSCSYICIITNKTQVERLLALAHQVEDVVGELTLRVGQQLDIDVDASDERERLVGVLHIADELALGASDVHDAGALVLGKQVAHIRIALDVQWRIEESRRPLSRLVRFVIVVAVVVASVLVAVAIAAAAAAPVAVAGGGAFFCCRQRLLVVRLQIRMHAALVGVVRGGDIVAVDGEAMVVIVVADSGRVRSLIVRFHDLAGYTPIIDNI